MGYFQGRSTKNVAHGWTLNWYDDFSSNTIDTDKWVLQEGGDAIFGAYDMWYTLRKDDESGANAYIEDGKLVLEAREEVDYGGHGENYTSAMIRTKDLKAFDVGSKIEIRAKLPATQGLFPAIWMSSQDELYVGKDSTQSRKLNGEIDIMEFLGSDTDKVYSTVWGYQVPDLSSYTDVKDFEDEYYLSDSGNVTKSYTDFTTSYHTFGMEWYADRMDFTIDCKIYHTMTFSDYQYGALYQPFQTTLNSFYLRMNVAVGGSWAGSPDETSVFPAKMYIDWVKYFTQQ